MLKYAEEYKIDARKQESKYDEAWVRVSVQAALMNSLKYDQVIQTMEDDLVFLAQHEYWSSYYMCYRRLLMAYFYSGQEAKAIQEAKTMYEEAKKLNHPEGISVAMLQLGFFYETEKRFEDALPCFQEALTIENQLNNLSLTKFEINFELAKVYEGLDRFDTLDAFLKEWETDLKKMDVKLGRKDHSLWRNFYRMHLPLYQHNKEWDKIEPCCQLIEQMGANVAILKQISQFRYHAFMENKQYQEAYKQVEIYQEEALDQHNFRAIADTWKFKAYTLAYLGRPAEVGMSIDSLLLVIAEQSQLDVNAQIDELRTQYEVDKLTAEKEKTRNYLLFALAGCLLLAIALGIWMYLHRQIAKKNRSLYIQIQELLQKEKEAEKLLLEVPEEELSRTLQLFKSLSELMQKEKPFTDPDLNRKKLADRLGSNESYLADAIREATGKTFSNYISDLRLQYTLVLMTEQPDLTFDAVAIDSGHGSYSAFLRLFTKKYGITPSEYRKLAAVKRV
jgi:AraC-like DNA-binding protein